MPTISVKGVPVRLYRELKRAASAERRSLNAEVIRRLEESVAPQWAADPDAVIARVRERQARYGFQPMTAEEVREAIRSGRP